MDNYKIEKFKWVCMEDSIGCKIGNFQTESNVIMLLKHPNKSVLFKLFHLLSTNPKLISQYRLTYTLYSGLNHVNYLNIIKRSCVGNRTDTSALSEWMVVRPFRSLNTWESERELQFLLNFVFKLQKFAINS